MFSAFSTGGSASSASQALSRYLVSIIRLPSCSASTRASFGAEARSTTLAPFTSSGQFMLYAWCTVSLVEMARASV